MAANLHVAKDYLLNAEFQKLERFLAMDFYVLSVYSYRFICQSLQAIR